MENLHSGTSMAFSSAPWSALNWCRPIDSCGGMAIRGLSGWRSALVIVKPDTVIAWHRKGFRLFWTWKVRHGRRGRPAVQKRSRTYPQLSRQNPLWGAPRIHGELLKLGIDIGDLERELPVAALVQRFADRRSPGRKSTENERT